MGKSFGKYFNNKGIRRSVFCFFWVDPYVGGVDCARTSFRRLILYEKREGSVGPKYHFKLSENKNMVFTVFWGDLELHPEAPHY